MTIIPEPVASFESLYRVKQQASILIFEFVQIL
jgi:hypothetical protein